MKGFGSRTGLEGLSNEQLLDVFHAVSQEPYEYDPLFIGMIRQEIENRKWTDVSVDWDQETDLVHLLRETIG